MRLAIELRDVHVHAVCIIIVYFSKAQAIFHAHCGTTRLSGNAPQRTPRYHGIGYALLESAEHGAGTAIKVGCKYGTMQPAERVELPFYDKEAEIPRGKRVDSPERP